MQLSDKVRLVAHSIFCTQVELLPVNDLFLKSCCLSVTLGLSPYYPDEFYFVINNIILFSGMSLLCLSVAKLME